MRLRSNRPRRSFVRPGLTKADKPSFRIIKTRMLQPAFRALRGFDVYASTNGLDCCGTCTAARLNSMADEWVAYHAQSIPDDPDDAFDGMFLQHSLTDEAKPLVRKALVNEGFVVTWDGSDERTIFVELPEPTGALWRRVREKMRLRALVNYWHQLTSHLHAMHGREGQALLDGYADVWDADAGIGPAEPHGEPGPTAAWEAVSFTRDTTFQPVEDDAPDTHGVFDDESGSGHEGLDDDDRAQLYRYYAHAEVEKLTLSDPEVAVEPTEPDAPPFRVLKGAELDQPAFFGPLRMASYSTRGQAREQLKDVVKVYQPRNKRFFTIAELHRTLEEHFLWIATAEQWAGPYNIDHCFFEGLHPHVDPRVELSVDLRGREVEGQVWDAFWGS